MFHLLWSVDSKVAAVQKEAKCNAMFIANRSMVSDTDIKVKDFSYHKLSDLESKLPCVGRCIFLTVCHS